MKKLFITIFIGFISVISYGIEIPDELINAIAIVESNNDWLAIGDNGQALGLYQLHAEYIDDVNRMYKTSYQLGDAFETTRAKDIVIKYLTKYGERYEKITGQKVTNEILARIHNGGPNGYKKEATKKYWNKIEKQMNKDAR